MTSISRKDRAKGSIIGAIIGDALGLGPHWYYDLDELKAEYGEWIDTYMPVKENPRFPDVWKSRKDLKPGDEAVCLLEQGSLSHNPFFNWV